MANEEVIEKAVPKPAKGPMYGNADLEKNEPVDYDETDDIEPAKGRKATKPVYGNTDAAPNSDVTMKDIDTTPENVITKILETDEDPQNIGEEEEDDTEEVISQALLQAGKWHP